MTCYSCDEAIQLSKLCIMTTQNKNILSNWMVCKFDLFFLYAITDFVSQDCKNLVKVLEEYTAWWSFYLPFDLHVNVTQTEFYFLLIFTSKSFKQIFFVVYSLYFSTLAGTVINSSGDSFLSWSLLSVFFSVLNFLRH